MKKKKLMLVFSSIITAMSLAGCGSINDFFEDESDSTIEQSTPEESYVNSEGEIVSKTTLYIGNYYGGLGDSWLRDLATKYEAKHPEVLIKIDNDKQKYLLDNISTTITSSRDALFFTEKIYYYDMLSQGLIADITDVVTTPLTEYNETQSIADKLDNQYKSYLADNDICNGKYYALPTYTSHHGMVYDVDLFENKKLFIGKNSTDDNIVWVNGKTQGSKSLGIDGVEGTYDDGLPANLTQFKKLMSAMISKSVTPFIWTGQYVEYPNGFLTGLWADYEGKDDFQLNYTFNGTTTIDGKQVTINDENAYELQKQEGKQYALDVARYITSDSVNYASSSALLTSTHLEAQDEFIASSPCAGSNGVKPIGILFEGDWWENEARENGDFDSMVNLYGSEYAYGTRRFGVMPFPKADGDTSNRSTYLSTSASNAFFVNAKASEKQQEIAKDFLRYCHSEEGLRTFTKYTGVIRPYTYQLSEEEYNGLTYFSKNLYECYNSKYTDIVYDLNQSNKRISNASYFISYWKWTTNISGNVYDNPFRDFINNTALTSKSYYEGLYNYHKNMWSTMK